MPTVSARTHIFSHTNKLVCFWMHKGTCFTLCYCIYCRCMLLHLLNINKHKWVLICNFKEPTTSWFCLLANYVWTKQPSDHKQSEVVIGDLRCMLIPAINHTQVRSVESVHTIFDQPSQADVVSTVCVCVSLCVRCFFTSSVSCITCSSSSTTTRVSLLFLKSKRVILGLCRQPVCFR